jgi:hypothetical protein
VSLDPAAPARCFGGAIQTREEKKMTRWLAGFLVLAAVAVLALHQARVEGQDKTADIKEVMTKAHKGPTSLIPVMGKELKSATPPWEEIQKQTKELVELATSLGKNPPPTGEKASWEKLTKQYLTNAKDLEEAAQKKDKQTAEAAHAKLRGSCSACHKAHRSQ